MTNHTPGPWSVGSDMWPYIRTISGPVGVRIGYATTGASYGVESYSITPEEAAANAHLMAAAPDLLAALEWIMEAFLVGDDWIGVPVADAARAAIAKAKGED